MESYKIIAGFSELKVVFQSKAKTIKTIDELKLWFTCEDDVFYMHDHAEHIRCVVLAIFEFNKWKILIGKGTLAERLINHIITVSHGKEIAATANELNALYGFKRF